MIIKVYIFFFYEFYCCKSLFFSTKLLWLYNKSVLHTMYGLIPGFYSVSLIFIYLYASTSLILIIVTFYNLGIRWCWPFSFLSLSQICFKMFHAHKNFRIHSSVSKKSSSFLLCSDFIFFTASYLIFSWFCYFEISVSHCFFLNIEIYWTLYVDFEFCNLIKLPQIFLLGNLQVSWI